MSNRLDRLKAWLEHSGKSLVRHNMPELVWKVIPRPGALPMLGWRMERKGPEDEFESVKPDEILNVLQEMQGDEKSGLFFIWLEDRIGHRIDSPEDNGEALYMVQDAAQWLELWADSGFIRWADGGPVEYRSQAASLSLERQGDDGARWIVEWKDESDQPNSRPMDELDIVVDSPIRDSRPGQAFIRDGAALRLLRTRDMPLEILHDIRQNPYLPRELLQDPDMGIALAQKLELDQKPAKTDSALVRKVAVQPSLKFFYRDKERLAMEAWAESESGTLFTRNHQGFWKRVSQNPEPGGEMLEIMSEKESTAGADRNERENGKAGDVFVVVPRPEDLEAIEAFMGMLLPEKHREISTDNVPEWEWSATPETIDRFLRHWSQRPSSIRYLGDRPFRSLVLIRRPPQILLQSKPVGSDWLKVSVEMEDALEKLSDKDVEKALARSKGEYALVGDSHVYRRDELIQYRRKRRTLRSLGIGDRKGDYRVHAIQLKAVSEDDLMELGKQDLALRELAERSREILDRFRGIPEAPVEMETAKWLRPYQRTGADFISWACRTFGGAILADDMGLGKTLQVIAVLSSLRSRHHLNPPSLIVCPSSLTWNWQREAAKFAPHLKTAIIQGGESRKRILSRLVAYDLVIVNYAMARRESLRLETQEWLMVCVDEAQAIKNPESGISKTMKMIPGKYRIALTGTPIENRLLDLWSIADFAIPHYLGSRDDFEQRVQSSAPEDITQWLKTRLKPVLLRRLKTEVASELPPRIEERRDCEMTDEQRLAYMAELKRTREMLENQGGEGDAIDGKSRVQILAALTRLRQICCDPAILGLGAKGSGKIEAMLEIVDEVSENGQKILIFSQFVKMLDRIELFLRERDLPLWKLTGQSKERQRIVQDFEAHRGPGVFLISLMAGGVGLNLTSASHIILFDPWWNPAIEAQAIDRSHRIGQKNPVLAFRLVSKDTIEERIMELQEEKQNLSRDIFDEARFSSKLNRRDLLFLMGD
ncbi:MAG: DEAD/DEAH box helicase [Candidatus Sumerlaeia bacterium]